MLTNTYRPLIGGIEKSVETFTAELRALGERTLVVTPAFEGATESDDLVERLPALREVFGSQFSFSLPIPAVLAERLDAFEPDVIHSHQPFHLGDSALRAARARGVPLVFTNHTLYERYAATLENEVISRFAEKLPVEYANHCDLVIAPTGSIKNILEARGVTARIKVLPTGIDTAFYGGGDGAALRGRFGLAEDTPVIGHLGRINASKNIAYLAEAAALAVEQVEGAVFLLVGEGEEVPTVDKVFAERGLTDRLVATGPFEGSDVADAYAAMDLFVFASKTDTQGLVLIEAMSGGVPIVALDAPGARDTIAHGKDGFIAPDDSSAQAFAEAIVNGLKASREGSFAEHARQKAATFDKEVCARRLRDAYQETIDAFDRDRATADQEGSGGWADLLASVQTELDLLGSKGAAVWSAITEEGDDSR